MFYLYFKLLLLAMLRLARLLASDYNEIRVYRRSPSLEFLDTNEISFDCVLLERHWVIVNIRPLHQP